MVGIGLLTCVAVGIFVFGRKHNTEPVRYRSVSTVRVAPKPPKENSNKTDAQRKRDATSTTQPNLELSGPQRFALRKSLLTTTLATSHLPRRARGPFPGQVERHRRCALAHRDRTDAFRSPDRREELGGGVHQGPQG